MKSSEKNHESTKGPEKNRAQELAKLVTKIRLRPDYQLKRCEENEAACRESEAILGESIPHIPKPNIDKLRKVAKKTGKLTEADRALIAAAERELEAKQAKLKKGSEKKKDKNEKVDMEKKMKEVKGKLDKKVDNKFGKGMLDEAWEEIKDNVALVAAFIKDFRNTAMAFLKGIKDMAIQFAKHPIDTLINAGASALEAAKKATRGLYQAGRFVMRGLINFGGGIATLGKNLFKKGVKKGVKKRIDKLHKKPRDKFRGDPETVKKNLQHMPDAQRQQLGEDILKKYKLIPEGIHLSPAQKKAIIDAHNIKPTGGIDKDGFLKYTREEIILMREKLEKQFTADQRAALQRNGVCGSNFSSLSPNPRRAETLQEASTREAANRVADLKKEKESKEWRKKRSASGARQISGDNMSHLVSTEHMTRQGVRPAIAGKIAKRERIDLSPEGHDVVNAFIETHINDINMSKFDSPELFFRQMDNGIMDEIERYVSAKGMNGTLDIGTAEKARDYMNTYSGRLKQMLEIAKNRANPKGIKRLSEIFKKSPNTLKYEELIKEITERKEIIEDVRNSIFRFTGSKREYGEKTLTHREKMIFKSKRNQVPVNDEMLENAKLNPKDRLVAAEKALGRELSPKIKAAIWKAHRKGKEGEGLGTYSRGTKISKGLTLMRALTEDHMSRGMDMKPARKKAKEEARILMDKGLAGESVPNQGILEFRLAKGKTRLHKLYQEHTIKNNEKKMVWKKGTPESVKAKRRELIEKIKQTKAEYDKIKKPTIPKEKARTEIAERKYRAQSEQVKKSGVGEDVLGKIPEPSSKAFNNLAKMNPAYRMVAPLKEMESALLQQGGDIARDIRILYEKRLIEIAEDMPHKTTELVQRFLKVTKTKHNTGSELFDNFYSQVCERINEKIDLDVPNAAELKVLKKKIKDDFQRLSKENDMRFSGEEIYE